MRSSERATSKSTLNGRMMSACMTASSAAFWPKRLRPNSGLAAIVGIGINLNDESFPVELEPLATSLKTATGIEVNRELLINELMKALTERYEVLQSDIGG